MRTQHLIIIAIVGLLGVVFWAHSSVKETQQIMRESTKVLTDTISAQQIYISKQRNIISAQRDAISQRDSTIQIQHQNLEQANELIDSYETKVKNYNKLLDRLDGIERSGIPERYRKSPADPR